MPRLVRYSFIQPIFRSLRLYRCNRLIKDMHYLRARQCEVLSVIRCIINTERCALPLPVQHTAETVQFADFGGGEEVLKDT